RRPGLTQACCRARPLRRGRRAARLQERRHLAHRPPPDQRRAVTRSADAAGVLELVRARHVRLGDPARAARAARGGARRARGSRPFGRGDGGGPLMNEAQTTVTQPAGSPFVRVEGKQADEIPAVPFVGIAYGFIWIAVLVYV